jgi:hypothetical protein
MSDKKPTKPIIPTIKPETGRIVDNCKKSFKAPAIKRSVQKPIQKKGK